MARRFRRKFHLMEDGSPVAALLSSVGGMTASFTFDVIFVGAGHNAVIVARCLARDSGSVCLLDQRPLPAKPRTASSESFLDGGDENCGRPKLTRPHDPSSESFMDDPQDFTKRSRTGSPYENPTSHPTHGHSKGEHNTATRAAIASSTPDRLHGRLLRDGPGIRVSTLPQGRRCRFGGGSFQIDPAFSGRPRLADSRLDGADGINVGCGLNELITSTGKKTSCRPPTRGSPGTSPPRSTSTVHRGRGWHGYMCTMRRCIPPVTRPT